MSENGTPPLYVVSKEHATLYAKMARVMAELKRIPKSGTNKHFGYKYATDADVADMVRAALGREGIAFFANMHPDYAVEKLGNQMKYTVTFDFTFACGETGATHTSTWISESLDNQDKGLSKAATNAEKYFLLKTFMLSTGDPVDDPDSSETEPAQENEPTTEEPKPQKQSGPRVGGGKQEPPSMNKKTWGDLAVKHDIPGGALANLYGVTRMSQVVDGYDQVDADMALAAESRCWVDISHVTPILKKDGSDHSNADGVRAWQARVKHEVMGEVVVELWHETFTEMDNSGVAFTSEPDWRKQTGEYKIHPPLRAEIVPAIRGQNYRPLRYEGGDYDVTKLPVEFESLGKAS